MKDDRDTVSIDGIEFQRITKEEFDNAILCARCNQRVCDMQLHLDWHRSDDEYRERIFGDLI